jgi:hypothetical protein
VTNFFGTLAVTRAFLAALERKGDGAAIAIVLSIAALASMLALGAAGDEDISAIPRRARSPKHGAVPQVRRAHVQGDVTCDDVTPRWCTVLTRIFYESSSRQAAWRRLVAETFDVLLAPRNARGPSEH